MKYNFPPIKLQNTLTKELEVFTPIHKDMVYMYHCGPTVYNYLQIGNLRAYVLADILRRTFEANGYAVKQVINITDVGHLTANSDEGFEDDGEDKIEKMAKNAGKTAAEISSFYTNIFFEDIAKLHIKTEGTLFPKASEHIQEQIELIQKLEKNGCTYKITDGIYFDTSTFPSYGKLGHINISGLMEGARVHTNSEKRNITDFALWKFSPENEKRFQEWESPWGVGFPGWHIECSAMSEKYLGKTFDIHTGGIDHIPVHHNNEIAQSESVNKVPLAHYWLHNAFVTVAEGKMSKSKGNFVRLVTLEEAGVSPLGYRYWLLNARYSTQVQFTLEAVQSAEQGYKKLVTHIGSLPTGGEVNEKCFTTFMSYMNDDLNTPKAIAYLWELAKNGQLSDADKKETIITCTNVLGLDIKKTLEDFSTQNKNIDTSDIPESIQTLLNKRKVARKEKNWKESDDLRDQIKKEGYDVKDTGNGQELFSL